LFSVEAAVTSEAFDFRWLLKEAIGRRRQKSSRP